MRFLILKDLDASKFVFLSVFTLKDTIYPKIWAKPLPKNAESLLPIDVRRSKTSLLKLINNSEQQLHLPVLRECPSL